MSKSADRRARFRSFNFAEHLGAAGASSADDPAINSRPTARAFTRRNDANRPKIRPQVHHGF